MPLNPTSGIGDGKLSEAEVVFWLKQALLADGLQGRRVRDILVDADASYLNSPFRRRLEPTGAVWIEKWRPDLICTVEHGTAEYIVGFEVKAASDYEKGVVQASRYRRGVHEAYLCIPGIANPTASWVHASAVQNGVGLALASRGSLQVEVLPRGPVPNPAVLRDTERYLLGQRGIRAFVLNKPLHYAAATFAFAFVPDPWEAVVSTWGLGAAVARAAVHGAESLGLMAAGSPTPKGLAVAEVMRALGFDLATARPLTKKRRLVEHEPGLAALLCSVLLDHPPVDLIMQVLLPSAGRPLTTTQVARRARLIDDGMTRAVFGDPGATGEIWQIRPTTRYQLKAAMYDVGLLDSPLGKGASGPQGKEGYDPETDYWWVSDRLP